MHELQISKLIQDEHFSGQTFFENLNKRLN
jgi:hypothetical protein